MLLNILFLEQLGKWDVNSLFALDLQDEFESRVNAFIDGTAYRSDCGGVHDQALRLFFNDTSQYFCEEAIQNSVGGLFLIGLQMFG